MSLPYVKKDWSLGDSITEADLDHLETGVQDLSNLVGGNLTSTNIASLDGSDLVSESVNAQLKLVPGTVDADCMDYIFSTDTVIPWGGRRMAFPIVIQKSGRMVDLCVTIFLDITFTTDSQGKPPSNMQDANNYGVGLANINLPKYRPTTAAYGVVHPTNATYGMKFSGNAMIQPHAEDGGGGNIYITTLQPSTTYTSGSAFTVSAQYITGIE